MQQQKNTKKIVLATKHEIDVCKTLSLRDNGERECPAEECVKPFDDK